MVSSIRFGNGEPGGAGVVRGREIDLRRMVISIESKIKVHVRVFMFFFVAWYLARETSLTSAKAELSFSCACVRCLSSKNISDCRMILSDRILAFSCSLKSSACVSCYYWQVRALSRKQSSVLRHGIQCSSFNTIISAETHQ
jgi:hypothetical protein